MGQRYSPEHKHVFSIASIMPSQIQTFVSCHVGDARVLEVAVLGWLGQFKERAFGDDLTKFVNWNLIWNDPESVLDETDSANEENRLPIRPFSQTPRTHLGSLLDELGRLNGPEGLSHLGAHHTGFWSTVGGYDYSIPMVIRGWGHDPGYETQVRWKKGASLAEAVLGQRRSDEWWELKDDHGAVYFSKRKPQPALRNMNALQQDMETDAKSKIKLILTCKDYSVTLVIKKNGERIGKGRRTVYWNAGGSLDLAVAGVISRDQWGELKDDNGVTYYSSVRHPGVQGDISALQREIENDPDSKRTLTLCLRDNR
jgi:hypothetical protein